MPGGAKTVICDVDWCRSFIIPIPSRLRPKREFRFTCIPYISRGGKIFSFSYLHYEGLSHSASHISPMTLPSRRNVCHYAGQIALSISNACSALSFSLLSTFLSIFHFSPFRSAIVWWSQERTSANTPRWFFILRVSATFDNVLSVTTLVCGHFLSNERNCFKINNDEMRTLTQYN